MRAVLKLSPLRVETHMQDQPMEGRTRLLNVGQAAAYLGVSAASLRKWSNQGLVPVYRTPGGQRRFSTGDLDEFMRSMRQPSVNGRRSAASASG
jgi:excisionase family DNA binding protein